MIKKLFVGTLILFTTVFIFLSTNVNAIELKRLPIVQVYDSKSFELGDNKYIAVLANDAITILDYNRNVIKKIDYDNENLLFAYNNDKTFKLEDVNLEIINENDNIYFAIIVNNSKSHYVNAIQVINYQNNEIMWQYQPTMKTNDTCGVANYCSENVSITDYEIKGNDLYIASGYLLQKINIKTGNILNTYQYKNNIWSFTFINDVNNNKSTDIALAVQASKVVMIDGKSFGFIKDITVSKDIISAVPDTNGEIESKQIKLNVWDVIYLEDSNKLVASAEDGYVYEINPTKNIITREIKVVDIATIPVKEYYYSYENNSMSYKNFYNYKMFTLRKILSYDYDTYEDYMIVYNENANKVTDDDITYNYFLISSQGGTYDKKSNTQFIDTDGKYVIEKSEESRSKMNYSYKQIGSNDEKFSSSVSKSAYKRLFSLDGYLLIFEHISKLSLYQNNDLIFEIPTINGENFIIKDNKLVVFDDLSYPRQISIYDKNNNLILDYYDESLFIKNYYFENDKLYVLYSQLSDTGWVMRVFDLNNGTIIKEDEMSITGCSIKKCNVYLYDDINNDGFSEFLIQKYPTNGMSTLQLQVYDVVNNSSLKEYNLDNLYYQRHLISVVNDFNNDDIKDIVLLDFGSWNRKINIYKINSNEQLDNYTPSDTVYLNSKWTSSPLFMENELTTDLNNDNEDEIIIKNANEYFLIDTKNGASYSLSNQYNTQPKSKLQSLDKDLDNDGYNEIVMIHENRSGVYVEVFEFKNNLSLKYTNSFDNPKLSIRDVEIAINDYNNDGIKDIISIAKDKNNNLNLVVFDTTKENIDFVPVKFNNNSESEILDNKSISYGEIVDLVTINNKQYYISRMKFNEDSAKYFFIDTTNNMIKYIFNDYNGFIGNKYIDHNNINKIILSDIYEFSKIELTKNGLFKNNIHVNFKDAFKNIGFVEIEINDNVYTSSDGDINFHLNPGKYHVYFTIYTTDGSSYNYYDIIEVNNFNLLYPLVVIVLASTIWLYVVIRKSIYKKFYRSVGN